MYVKEKIAVHTAEDLTSSSFVITSDQQRFSVPELFPGFDERDRLGVIVRSPCGAVGASALILATITAFYDIQRQRSKDFFIYPDYFLFHVGGPLGDHKMLDIFPSHKEVVVDDSPEDILRAINDRAVIFWAIVLATVSVALMAACGLEPLQTLSIITGLPLIFVLGIAALSFRKWLIEDRPHERGTEAKSTQPQAEDEARAPEPTGARKRS